MEFGAIVDVETTGLNPETDHIFEIAVIRFRFNATDAPSFLEAYSAMQPPPVPLSPEIEQLTGVTNDLLQGQAIDWLRVKNMLASASVIVAHNMKFDRAFIKRRPELMPIEAHWACSMEHIDWQAMGYGNRTLTYLAADHGFLNPFPHRALFDCATTLRLMGPYFSAMLERSYEKEFRLNAWSSPFETKDRLKAKGYRWDAEQRVWFKICAEKQVSLEQEFLIAEIYPGGKFLGQIAEWQG